MSYWTVTFSALKLTAVHSARLLLRLSIAGLALLPILMLSYCTVIVSAGVRYAIFGPDGRAIYSAPQGALISLEIMVADLLLGKAEYEVFVILETSGKRLREKFKLDWGGHLRTNLYRTPERRYLLLDAQDALIIDPLAAKIRADADPKMLKNFDQARSCLYRRHIGFSIDKTRTEAPSRCLIDLVYLGAFDVAGEDGRAVGSHRDGLYQFIPAGAQPEWVRCPIDCSSH
ncbi:MAG: hypothetical protein EKK41_07275 [Hyphomicrobiales bacterium]|nr:MAG: hypothetical protein EKK41_07275 [Hyphomicrobiales bacterium]